MATHLVYFGRVPRAEKHELDRRSLKQHPNVRGPLIAVTVVKTLSKHRRNVSRANRAVSILKNAAVIGEHSLCSPLSLLKDGGVSESSDCTFDESIKL